jgi:hypothetical protein
VAGPPVAPPPVDKPKKVVAAAQPEKAREPKVVERPKKTKPEEAGEKPAKGDAKPEKAAAAAGEGYLRIGSKPWTNIAVDGKDTGLHTPQTKMKLPVGSHRISLTNPQFNIKETFSVDSRVDQTETVIKDLRPQGSDD